MIISKLGVTNHGRTESFFLHVEQSIAAITGRQLRNQRVDEYRSSTISDHVGVRQGYLLRFRAKLFWSIKTYWVARPGTHYFRARA